jgi:rhodanese-related sulfurtransferase
MIPALKFPEVTASRLIADANELLVASDLKPRRLVPLFRPMKKISSFLTAIVLVSLLGAAGGGAGLVPTALADETGAVRHVDPDGAARYLADTNVVVLDVRTPDEFAAGHIKGAKLVDFKSTNFATKLGELDRNKTYLVHCAVGGRSRGSLETFRKLGFKSIVHLDGGFSAWKRAGKPVEK